MISKKIEDITWYSGIGLPVKLSSIVEFVRHQEHNHGKIYIGTDSHRSGKNFIFSTVVCLHGADGQDGGHYFFYRKKRKKSNFAGLQQRLIYETESSLEVANALRDVGISNIEIHIDCSPKTETHQSGRSADLLQGYVIASGFDVLIKPYSWAASSIADRHAR